MMATPKRATTKMSAKPTGLVGRCFVTWGEGGKVGYQGRVVAELPDGYYLVQFFDFIVGEPSTMAVFHISKLASEPNVERSPDTVTLFEDDEHLRFWFDHRYRPPSGDEA